jgi:hypothetical protein
MPVKLTDMDDPADVETKKKPKRRSAPVPTQQPTTIRKGAKQQSQTPVSTQKLEVTESQSPTLTAAAAEVHVVVSNDDDEDPAAEVPDPDDKESSSSDEGHDKDANRTTVPSQTNTFTSDDKSTKVPPLPPTNATDTLSLISAFIPPYNREKAQNFQTKWCILPETTEWFPSSINESWQLRAPRFMLIGARDSGTTLLTSHLSHHSSLIPTWPPESNFFSVSSFDKAFVSPKNKNDEHRKIHVRPARQRMYARHYPVRALRYNVSLMSMDATPHYLLQNPHSILCVCPWVKLVVILRNPAHRVYASYQKAVSKMGWTGTLEDYISLDVKNMKRAGLLSSGGDTNRTVQDMWKTYLSITTDGPVGRSLYGIQLRQWFQALQEMGRDPSEAIIILRYEEYNENADRDYQRVLKFLDLPLEQKSVATIKTNNSMVVEKRDEETMKRLSKFFQPYNQQLYKLLGDDWKDCWND